MDVIIDELIIESDRLEHITKHGVTVEEVLEIVFGDYVWAKGKFDRTLLTGRTSNQRLITAIVGKRARINRYGLVTARDAKKKEKALYLDKFETGGEK